MTARSGFPPDRALASGWIETNFKSTMNFINAWEGTLTTRILPALAGLPSFQTTAGPIRMTAGPLPSPTEMNNCLRLSDRVAVVVGATSGIGRALAVGLAQHGADVVPTGRRRQGLEEACRGIEGAGGRTTLQNPPRG